MTLARTVIHNDSCHLWDTEYMSGPILGMLQLASHLLFTKILMQWADLSSFCGWGSRLTELSWPRSRGWGCGSGRWTQILSSSLALKQGFMGCKAVCKLYLCWWLQTAPVKECYPILPLKGWGSPLVQAAGHWSGGDAPGDRESAPFPQWSPAAEEPSRARRFGQCSVWPPRPSRPSQYTWDAQIMMFYSNDKGYNKHRKWPGINLHSILWQWLQWKWEIV